jgi:hypothetical protein
MRPLSFGHCAEHSAKRIRKTIGNICARSIDEAAIETGSAEGFLAAHGVTTI